MQVTAWFLHHAQGAPVADVKERLTNTSIEVTGSSPDGLLTQMKSDTIKLGKVIKAAGIRANS